MPVTNQLKNQHLLWRAAFGPMTENANELGTMTQKKLFDLLVKTSSKEPKKLDVASTMFDGLVKGVQDLAQLQNLTQEQKKIYGCELEEYKEIKQVIIHPVVPYQFFLCTKQVAGIRLR